MQVRRGKFITKFLEYAGGMGLAQVVSLLLMPLIARLYGPAEMGVYAVYLAISSIIGNVASLRFDIAVVIAESEDEARRLVWSGFVFSTLMGAGVAVVLSLVIQAFALNFGPLFVPMTALSVVFLGITQSLVGWHNRLHHYRRLSTRNTLERVMALGLAIVLSHHATGMNGLIVGQSVGFIFSAVFLLSTSKLGFSRGGFEAWKKTVVRYSDFPRKNLFTNLLNTFSIFGPSLLFAGFFARQGAGSYSLASRMLEMPITLIGNTFQTVYYPHVRGKSQTQRRSLFKRSLSILLLAGIPPVLVLMFWGESLFLMVFGPLWAEAGRTAVWLAPLTLVRIAYVSQSPLLLVNRKLNLELWISLSQCLAQVGGFFIGYALSGNFQQSVAWMAGLGIVTGVTGLLAIGRTLR
jgi:O-antigen/teichoic acid export membrane protein